jgi:hypothetical protein
VICTRDLSAGLVSSRSSTRCFASGCARWQGLESQSPSSRGLWVATLSAALHRTLLQTETRVGPRGVHLNNDSSFSSIQRTS